MGDTKKVNVGSKYRMIRRQYLREAVKEREKSRKRCFSRNDSAGTSKQTQKSCLQFSGQQKRKGIVMYTFRQIINTYKSRYT